MKTILLTGAAGDVAQHLRRELAARYKFRLSDLRPCDPLRPNETFVRADIADMAEVLPLMTGVDAVVHLGGFSVEGTWEVLLQANIVGCYNIFEAARQAGVKRVLFASSNHAVGFYRRDQKIDHTAIPRPDSRYGVTKAFGEALGSLYAEKYGLEVLSIRIGNVHTEPADRRRLAIWFSPRDLAQLVSIGIDSPQVKNDIVYGMSDNARAWWDNSNARRLGYAPQDKSEDYAAAILAQHKDADPKIETYQGGTFVLAEIGGDPQRDAQGRRK
jgi:uronate dehydrogenase